ncbi:MAG: helix-turn-helix transcriptional regulator [Eubacterium sp.]|nr:helix-turn-helix transcriptional regulator [Eubacterium sp.]
MDQIRIGKFIAVQRKQKGYTQKKLAELLGISDKTVSKWECGKGFPEVSLLLPLCKELEISVNELLAGEKVSEEDYQRKAEENMVNLVKETQESKKKIILSVMAAMLGVAATIPLFIISEIIPMSSWLRILLMVLGIGAMTVGIIMACILDRDAGAFECPSCHERFVPEMRAYIMGPHTITKRKLKCPKCGKTRYCRHVLTKNM